MDADDWFFGGQSGSESHKSKLGESMSVTVKGLDSLINKVNNIGKNGQMAAKESVEKMAAAVERQARINANTGSHPKGSYSMTATPLIPFGPNSAQVGRAKTSKKGFGSRGSGHIPGTGPGPNMVTGTLNRSIIYTSNPVGLVGYMAVVGPTAIYGRAVELGNPRWKSGVKYPYLRPAYEELMASGELQAIHQAVVNKYILGRG